MKKPMYKRELSHSYLVIENIPEELSGHYQYRMILRNRIPGLLASSERYMEGRACLYYDISSRQSLEQLYLSAKIGMKEIRGIIDNLAQVLDSMAEYLLEERFLILEPEYIYMDLETEQLFFLYYPFRQDEEQSRYLPLAEFFLEHVDHREEMAVSAAYQFYKMSKAESFMVGSFRTFLEKGMQEERQKAAEEEPDKTKYGYAGMRITERNAAVCFYEEEGPYEYCGKETGNGEDGFENEECEWEKGGRWNGKSPEAWEDGKREKKTEESGGQEEEERKKRRKAAAGLLAAAVLFLLICACIWYLRPEGAEKTAMFLFLAADGLFLLICLWKATARRMEEERESEPEEEEEEMTGGGASFWEEYEPHRQEELEGPTVYLSRSGAGGENGTVQRRRPRVTGTADGTGERGMEYSLERLPVLVGKLKSRAQILLADASVSRIHARFVEREGRTALIDLNSTNGTFVNGVRLEQEEVMMLEDGDELRFGNVQMRYEE